MSLSRHLRAGRVSQGIAPMACLRRSGDSRLSKGFRPPAALTRSTRVAGRKRACVQRTAWNRAEVVYRESVGKSQSAAQWQSPKETRQACAQSHHPVTLTASPPSHVHLGCRPSDAGSSSRSGSLHSHHSMAITLAARLAGTSGVQKRHP